MNTEITGEANGTELTKEKLERLKELASNALEFKASHWSVYIPHLLELIDHYDKNQGLTFNAYQDMAKTTAIYPGTGNIDGLCYAALGLAGEAGEVANKVKKILRDKNGVLTDAERYAIGEEIGDVLWYLAAVSHELMTNSIGEYEKEGLALEKLAKNNYVKLSGRLKRGKIGGSGDKR